MIARRITKKTKKHCEGESKCNQHSSNEDTQDLPLHHRYGQVTQTNFEKTGLPSTDLVQTRSGLEVPGGQFRYGPVTDIGLDSRETCSSSSPPRALQDQSRC